MRGWGSLSDPPASAVIPAYCPRVATRVSDAEGAIRVRPAVTYSGQCVRDMPARLLRKPILRFARRSHDPEVVPFFLIEA